MKNNEVQLMIYGDQLKDFEVQTNSDKIEILDIHDVKNDSYAFIDIKIHNNCRPGEYIFSFSKNDNKQTKLFSVLKRETGKLRYTGFDAEDIIYLITPDRFANGDESNDNVKGMLDFVDRSDILRRHGGDIQGIINNLDYIKDLGFTAIWINPLLENDMNISYHGYAATDLYKIDPRFGSNNLYKKLIKKAHTLGLKIILDHVSNHVGMFHPWVQNPPTPDWFHGNLKNHINAEHDKSVLLDPYADISLSKNIKEGWFVSEMPDLNQSNIYLSKYLIQNTLWWIEMSGINGIREDTYPYVNQQYLSDWANTIFFEYPNFNIVGEIWMNDPVYIAPFQKQNKIIDNLQTGLPSVTDFALMEAIGKVLNQGESIDNIYRCLTKDYLYADPDLLLTFIDNHDVMRLWDLVNGNIYKYQMGLVLLFTLRGIPQIYYGTELGLPGGNDHGLIRRDLTGGFKNDSVDVFNQKNLNENQKIIFHFLKNIISIKKENKSLTVGSLKHFPPNNEIYYYLRKYEQEEILIIINNNNDQEKIIISNLINFNNSDFKIRNLITGQILKIEEKQQVEIDKFGYLILKIIQN